MRKHGLIFSALLLLVVSLSSCGNQEETFHTLELDVKGIDLVKEAGVYIGKIDSSALEFTITGKGRYARFAYVTSIMIDGIIQERPGDLTEDEPPFLDTYPKLEGDWGKISYMTTKPPYTMQFRLNPNREKKNRTFEFQLGFGYWYEIIRITQEAASEHPQVFI